MTTKPKADDATEVAPIDIMALRASLNHMSTDDLSKLQRKLAILHMVHDVNRWRHTEPAMFIHVKAVLAGAGVKLD